MTRRPSDLGASAQAKLRNLAKTRGDDVQILLIQFVLERLLCRLAASTHAREFLLKGAMLFAAWTDEMHRATRDLDLLGSGKPDLARLEQVFRAIVTTVVDADGVTFDANSVRAARIREGQIYQGVRVTMTAALGTTRLGVQVDVGFGDVVHPGPIELHYPSLLDLPTPQLLAYPRECVVAEKFQAMVSLGELNSRMKDFYDVFTPARQFTFYGPMLAAAIEATFARRMTDLPRAEPLALRTEFAELHGKQVQWRAFVRRGRLVDGSVSLGEVVAQLHAFLWPIVRSLVDGSAAPGAWQPSGPWSPVGTTMTGGRSHA